MTKKPDLLNWKFYIQACRKIGREMGIETRLDVLEGLFQTAWETMTPAQRGDFALNDCANSGLYDAFQAEEEYAEALQDLCDYLPFGKPVAFASAFAIEFSEFVKRHELEAQMITELIVVNPARYDGMFWSAEAPFHASVAEAAREFGLSAQEADEAARGVWSQILPPEFEMKHTGREKQIFVFIWVYGARAVNIAREVHSDFARERPNFTNSVPKTITTVTDSMVEFAREFIKRRETSCGSTVPGSLRLNS